MEQMELIPISPFNLTGDQNIASEMPIAYHQEITHCTVIDLNAQIHQSGFPLHRENWNYFLPFSLTGKTQGILLSEMSGNHDPFLDFFRGYSPLNDRL